VSDLALGRGVPGLRVHAIKFEFVSRLFCELKQKLLGGAPVTLPHRVPNIDLPIVMREALDESGFLKSLQVIFGREVGQDFLAPALEAMGRRF
jgi:hypothetical protein